MNLEPLYLSINQLNRNVETLIGLVAAGKLAGPAADVAAAGVVTGAAVSTAPTETTPPADAPTEAEGKRGRPRKHYYFNSEKAWVQENTGSPGAGWVEVTKTKFEEIRNKIASGEIKPTTLGSPSSPTAKPVDEDPFADDAPAAAAPTLEDVRKIAFALRDKHGMDKAKALIAKFAAKLDEIKPERYAEFIQAATDALNPTDDAL